MLTDTAAGGRDRFTRTFDVCVIGAGPAGITLARALAAKGLDVALMEAGGADYSDESQAFYAGEAIGVPNFPTDESRLRFLGGTSGHWEGKCRTLEAYDFEARPWVPLSGWPIGKADLDPYQPRAAEILDVAQPTELSDLPLEQSEERFRHFEWRWSAPTHFGEKYRDELAASGRIALGLNANLVDLRLSDDLSAVTAAAFRSYAPGDPGFTVRARAFALCLGGLENPRALLNCRSQVATGIGNGNDQVGRYFCDRPTVYTSDLMLAAPIGEENLYFAGAPGFLAAHRLTGFAVSVEPRRPRSPKPLLSSLSSTAQCITPAVARLVTRIREQRPRCYVGGLDEFGIWYDPEAHPFAAVGVTLEQTLNPDSRVTLAEATDGFGLRRLRLDWRLTEADYRAIRMSALAFGAHVAEQDIGRLKLRPWVLEEPMTMPALDSGNGFISGRQHMCSTRMSADPRTGVVDADCRVHGMTNLYLGGSSVFATPGFTKPTYTIVQLSLRLGDHLGGLLAT